MLCNKAWYVDNEELGLSSFEFKKVDKISTGRIEISGRTAMKYLLFDA